MGNFVGDVCATRRPIEKKTMTPAHITSGSRQNGIEETLRSKIKGQTMVISLAHQPRRGRRDTRSGNNFAVWGRAACLSLPEPHHSVDGGAKLARAGTQLSLEH
jgi:hypothetical protein